MGSRLNRVRDWQKLAEQCDYRVDETARRCKVSRRTLLRFFLQRFQVTPKAWMDGLRAENAARAIMDGESLKVIAIEIHCKHPSTFTRFFKRLKGTLPKEYVTEMCDVSNG